MEEVKKEIENSVTVQSGSRIITVEEQLRNQIKMVIDGASFDLRFCANAFGISNDELESNFFIKYVESLKSNAKDKTYIDMLEVSRTEIEKNFPDAFKLATKETDKEALDIALRYIGVAKVLIENSESCYEKSLINSSLRNIVRVHHIIGGLSFMKSPVENTGGAFDYLLKHEKKTARKSRTANQEKEREARKPMEDKIIELWNIEKAKPHIDTKKLEYKNGARLISEEIDAEFKIGNHYEAVDICHRVIENYQREENKKLKLINK